MSQQPFPPSDGRTMPNGRPRPGATGAAGGPPTGAPSFQARPDQVDYGMPRLYSTSVRPASGLTGARAVPVQIDDPVHAQPQSAWATQTRRAQEVSQQGSRVPVSTIVSWVLAAVVGIGAVLVVLVTMLLLYTSEKVSLAALPVFAIAALFSLLIIIGVIAVADRWDPQPFPLLLIAVAWGVGITLLAGICNDLIMELLYALTGSEDAAYFLGATFGAPLVEETAKGLGLVLLFLVARRRFNGPLDGLIYGALIGGGFAFTENIMYYVRSFGEAGADAALHLVLIRGLLGIFGHPIYTSLTGVIMGLVARKWGTIPGLLSFLVATWPGMFLHALWNGGSGVVYAMLPEQMFYVVTYGLEFLLYILWIILIVVLMFDESRLTRVRLGDYANRGWLTHQEVDMLATWKGRREGRRWARSIGAAPLMKRFIRESAELASTRQRLLADGPSPKRLADERRLLGRMTENRRDLLARAAASGQVQGAH